MSNINENEVLSDIKNMKLTQKHQETIDIILSKEKELGKKLYIIYANGINKMFIADLIDANESKINGIQQVNTKVVYSLLSKGIIVSEPIRDNFSLATLSPEFRN